jgi:hypothetical protein
MRVVFLTSLGIRRSHAMVSRRRRDTSVLDDTCSNAIDLGLMHIHRPLAGWVLVVVIACVGIGKDNRVRTNASPRQDERRFFAWCAAFIVLLVFAGFSRTYFLHTFFQVPAPLLFLRVHGAVMSGWILIYFIQTMLVSANRVAVHRTFGMFGSGYAALVVGFGTAATFLSARREVRGHTDAVFSFLNVFGLELAQMFLFATLVAAAIWLRNQPAHHKRLMLLATLCILPNAIVRLFLNFFQTNLAFLSIWAVMIVVIVLIDSVGNRRLHPAFGIGATVALIVMYFAQFASRTQAWQVFASHLVR